MKNWLFFRPESRRISVRDRTKVAILITNRKSHTHFRLVPKSTTLDDLERPLRTLFQNTCVFGANYENLNKDGPILQQECSPVIPISGSVNSTRKFAGSLERGRETALGWSKTAIFSAFVRFIF